MVGAPSYDDRARYAQYAVQLVDAMRLPNISGAEVVAVHSRVTASGVKNRLPKPWGLLRLLYGLAYDQLVRFEGGAPLRFNSLYRETAYNRAIGGASKSAHRACTARDRVLVGHAPTVLYAVDRKLAGTRVSFSPEQQAVIRALRSDYALGLPLTEAVYGEPFRARTLAADVTGFTHVGGLGLYRRSGFVHADCRGIASRWDG